MGGDAIEARRRVILANDLAIYLATENAFLHRLHFFYSILQQNVRQSDSIRNVGFCFSTFGRC